MSQFLCHTLSNRYAVSHITLYIQGLLLIVIERCHIRIGEVVCRFHIHRRGVKHCGNQCFRVTISCRCRRSFPIGLCHIKHFLHIVGNACCTVTLCIFHRFKNGNALSTLCDFNVVFAPVIKIFKLYRLRILLVNQKCVDCRISVKSALRIKERFEFLRRRYNLFRRFIRKLIHTVFLSSFLLGIFLFGKSWSLTVCLCRSKIFCHCNYLSFGFFDFVFGCWCTVCFGAEGRLALSVSGSLRSASFCCFT